jgi:diguanylate cyclase
MSYQIIDLLIAAMTATVGLAAGWWLRTIVSGSHVPTDSPGEDTTKSRSREIVSRLYDLAANMAANVDDHSNRVQEINDELRAIEHHAPEDVLSAMAKLVDANEQMQQQLASAEQKLNEQAQQIESHVAEARTDALTKLANRRAFDDEMSRCQADFRRNGRPSSVLMIDVDNFKKFNDTYGHQAGDEVLRGVGRVLRRQARDTEVVTRYGGEEFAVVFPGSEIAGARIGAERIRAAIGAASFQFEGRQLHVTASAGLAQFRPNEDATALIKRADVALYASKEAGRDRGHWHDGEKCHPLADKSQSAPEKSQRSGSSSAAAHDSSKDNPAARSDRLDPLTGLSNRTSFCEDLNRRVAEWKRGGATLSVILLQIDDYATSVKQRGRGTADIVLRAATQFLEATMRDMDHVARYDDDTFALMLPGAKLDDTVKVAERLRNAIARCKLPIPGAQFQFTISLGAAESRHGDSSLSLLERTQAALDTAVREGRNRTYLHNGEHSEPVTASESAVR